MSAAAPAGGSPGVGPDDLEALWHPFLDSLPEQGRLLLRLGTLRRHVLTHPDRMVRQHGLRLLSGLGDAPAPGPAEERLGAWARAGLVTRPEVQAELLVTVAARPAEERATVRWTLELQQHLLTSGTRAVRVAALALTAAMRHGPGVEVAPDPGPERLRAPASAPGSRDP